MVEGAEYVQYDVVNNVRTNLRLVQQRSHNPAASIVLAASVADPYNFSGIISLSRTISFLKILLKFCM